MSMLEFYTYTYVGLSALLVSTYRAMRRPSCVERATGLAPRFFVYDNRNMNVLRQGVMSVLYDILWTRMTY